MPSSVQEKPDPQKRLVSDEEALVIPDNARPSDDMPTVISRTTPIVEPTPSSQQKIVDLSRKNATPEAIVAGVRGKKLAHFELIEPIGVGGMAAVIRARDMQLDRTVALKILPPEMAEEPENVQRFHHEARSAAKLDHANIARVFFCGEDQGLHFIAFEFVEGMNLRNLLEKRGQLSVGEAVRYIVQIATGLEHAATRGVVHRDVKPSNIIITPEGQAKLVDMGLARNLERQGERDLTHSGMTLGTFDYISPEQALEPREADARSDIYSLGCTLYHMLTGQPPVPDGTPAKKLDHHQHHKPIDPRHLNPEISVEIVRILDKMMAKNPKDRYQRPIHVVHHLMKAAQQSGIADGMPEVLLFTETPLPGESRGQPFLYVGLALAALVILIFGLSFLPDSTPRNIQSVPTPPENVKGPGPNPPPNGSTKVDGDADKLPEVINDAADLKRVLADTGTQVKVPIDEKVDLDSSGLIYKGTSEQSLVLGSDDSDSDFKTINFKYKPKGSAFGLTLESGKSVVFRRIRFVLESLSLSTPNRPAGAIALRGVKNVTFDQCIFVQEKMPTIKPNLVPLASVYIEGSDSVVPVVDFTDCYFGGAKENGGQVAVAVNGPATINVRNDAFQPHSAFFSFRDKCRKEHTKLTMEHCTGFVELGPVFRFSKDASARLRVRGNAFSRPGGGYAVREGLPDLPSLIALGENSSVQFEGQDNLYHNLNGLVEKKSDKLLIAKSSDFDVFLRKTGGSDLDSVSKESTDLVLNHPNPLESLELYKAFQLKPEYHGKYGLQSTWMGTMPEPVVIVAKAPKKIVDPDVSGFKPGVYPNLQAAISVADDNDTIFIKHGKDSRDVVVPPVVLKTGISVTLKPFDETFQPVLVLDKTIEENDSALFKVQKSKLIFENLKIRLAPGAGFTTRSVVQMGESAHCIFKGCTFSMRPRGDGKLNIVTFFDLGSMMKMDPPVVAAAPARVEFQECFVKGKGDLVALQGCRLLHVHLSKSLVALDGSLLDVDAGAKEMPMDQGVHWTMTRTSVFTKKSLFALRSQGAKGLTRTYADITGCLLTSLAPDQSVGVVEINKDDKPGKFLEWKGKANFYANFDNMRDNMREWREQVSELDSKDGKLTIKLSEDAMQALWDATPDMLKAMDPEQERMIDGYGMPPDAEKRLMQAPPEPIEP